MPKRDLPDYRTPPIAEVACGIFFDPLVGFSTAHVGLIWNEFSKDFPNVEERPPLLVPAQQDHEIHQPGTTLEISNVPQWPRVWFISAAGERLIQIQRGAMFLNWRKIKERTEYPRFDAINSEFFEHWARLEEFSRRQSLGKVTPKLCELTYVNHIPQGQGWNDLGDIRKLFPDFLSDGPDDRFLPPPVGFAMQTTYLMPESSGRLTVTIKQARMNQETPLIRLELAARGLPAEPSKTAIRKWYRTAHEWIVRGFTDFTSKDIQSGVWGRIQ